jgi:hypothetical protein
MSSEDTALEAAVGMLGEHFENYAIVVQYTDGSVWHQGNNDLTERALYQEALMMMREERQWEKSDVEIDWEDDDDEDDWVHCGVD